MRLQPHIDTGLSGYFGSKEQPATLARIINQISPHDVFVSGFAGNCAVTRYKRPAGRTVLYDLDLDVVEAWDIATIADPRVVVARTNFLLLLELTSAAEAWTRGGSAVFTFLDPPYPIGTRTSNNRYKHELTDEQHEQLLEKAKHLPGDVMICTYPNDIYTQALGDEWRLIEYEAVTRGGMRTEQLWMNYEEPTELHDYRFLGADRREREVIKRRRETILRKLERLPVLERRAALRRINEKF